MHIYKRMARSESGRVVNKDPRGKLRGIRNSSFLSCAASGGESDPPEIELLGERSPQPGLPPAGEDASAVVAPVGFSLDLKGAELLEDLDKKVTATASMVAGLRKVMEGMKTLGGAKVE